MGQVSPSPPPPPPSTPPVPLTCPRPWQVDRTRARSPRTAAPAGSRLGWALPGPESPCSDLGGVETAVGGTGPGVPAKRHRRAGDCGGRTGGAVFWVFSLSTRCRTRAATPPQSSFKGPLPPSVYRQYRLNSRATDFPHFSPFSKPFLHTLACMCACPHKERERERERETRTLFQEDGDF